MTEQNIIEHASPTRKHHLNDSGRQVTRPIAQIEGDTQKGITYRFYITSFAYVWNAYATSQDAMYVMNVIHTNITLISVCSEKLTAKKRN